MLEINYNDIENKQELENYEFIDETIKLEEIINISNCKFDNIIFDELSIIEGNIEDTVFYNVDLSKVKFYNVGFYRVKFINCKLLGTSFIDCIFKDININNTLANYINIAGCDIKNFKVKESNFTESTLMECKMKNVEFDDVNFKNSEFINTSLKSIDLSNANIENIKIDINYIKGAIITHYQAMDLISVLGVKIKE